MKKIFIAASVAALALTSCRQNDSMVESSNFGMNAVSAADYNVTGLPVTAVSGTVANGTIWSGVVELDGVVVVPNGVTLTIQPGTFIKAKPHADGSATGVLVVQKGGKLNAVGTASQPIVFTSYNLLDGNDTGAPAKPGDFGGVVLLGDAPTNMPDTTVIEGLSGANFSYGGTNASHSAGTLKYVRIEFAGYELPTEKGTGNEINGLTCGGVGNGTTLDHIQVSYGADDAFEFFGGTVNASNLVAFAYDDDGFDFDQGYTGTLSNALSLADYNSTHSKDSKGNPDSNGIELDNNATGVATGLLTHPTINNLTIVGAENGTEGAKYKSGILVRRYGQLTLNNAVVTGYPIGIRVQDNGSQLFATDWNLVKAHGFTTAVTGAGTANIPSANLATGTPAKLWGMTQPFFNKARWNVSPRNTGDFQGPWTKYTF